MYARGMRRVWPTPPPPAHAGARKHLPQLGRHIRRGADHLVALAAVGAAREAKVGRADVDAWHIQAAGALAGARAQLGAALEGLLQQE
eukprot:114897-Chlamydomonas_euryale.AAC.1